MPSPTGVRPYAENWTYSLVKSMHRAGFDMPTMTATPALTGGVSPHNVLPASFPACKCCKMPNDFGLAEM